MTAIFAIAGGIAAIWSIYKQQTVYYALVNSFPLQFQEELSARFAFHGIALSPSTPLSLQADYVKSLAGFCFAVLCLSLVCFSFQEVKGGYLFLAISFVGVASTIKSWITYQANCNRPAAGSDEEEP